MPLPDPVQTARFQERRERIIAAAATLINQHGVKGMTFAEVARLVEMNNNSIAYYFKRKELLAAAAFHDTLDRMEAKIDEAGVRPTPRDRVDRYLQLVFAAQLRLRRGEDRVMTALSDIRSLDEPHRSELSARYQTISAKMRGWFDPGGDATALALARVRAHILLEGVLWLPIWLRLYSSGDFDRVRRRLFELLDRGVAPKGERLAPVRLDIGLDDVEANSGNGGEAYLRAATRLINRRGYRGASVERIASELNVTKGSFYHHLAAKDDLVLACFTRSYDTVSRTQQAAHDAGGTYWQRLSAAVATLIDVQFSDRGPLLRTTALTALPTKLRGDVVARSNRMAQRFAGMMIDGIGEGSILAIDPLVASQAIMSMLNAAFELRGWAEEIGRDQAVALYASTLTHGMFTDPPALAGQGGGAATG